MNKFLLFISLLITIGNSHTTPPINSKPLLCDLEYQQKFTDFLVTYNKSYTNDEFTQRFLIFKDTLNYILNFNEHTGNDIDSLKLDINQFADITVEEYTKIYLNKIIDTSKNPKTTTSSCLTSSPSSSTTGCSSGGLLTGLLGNLLGTNINILSGISSKEENTNIHTVQSRKLNQVSELNEVNTLNVDWRSQAPTVKNQGQCGSGYAFSAIGSVEAAIKRRYDNSVLLSEQEIVDCSGGYGNYGCDGGFMTASFNYIKGNGISYAQNYSYEERVGRCRSTNGNKVTIKGHVAITNGNEAALENALSSLGPISVGIDANPRTFMMYKNGIYDDPSCTSTPTHAALAVGMGTENGIPYYLVKNSFGTSWGEEGYIRIARGKNRCGIASMASYPVV